MLFFEIIVFADSIDFDDILEYLIDEQKLQVLHELYNHMAKLECLLLLLRKQLTVVQHFYLL